MSPVNDRDRIFSPEEYAGRLGRVRAVMRDHDLDALVVTSPENIYYLVGLNHQGYFAFTMLVLPVDGDPVLVTRAMEHVIVAKQAPHVIFIGYADREEPAVAAVRAVERAGCAAGRIGFDASSMLFPPAVWHELVRDLPQVDWVDTSVLPSADPTFRVGLVDGIRLVKSAVEIECVRRAAAISDRAARAGIDATGVGVNEIEVGAAIYDAMVRAGGEYPGFVPLVRSTDTLHEEHTTWRNHILMPGDLMFIELSGSYARYHAPLGRTIHTAPSGPGVNDLRAVAVAAIGAACGALRPGATSGDVYAAWQATVDDGLGHGRLRRHHCGYNVGIGFPPSWVGSSTVLGLRPNGKVPIESGMVFHLWAWIHDDDLGDYLLSDTAVVTDTGAHLLTTTTRPTAPE